MDIQDLQSRIIEINAEMAGLRTSYSKLEGHLAECHHWMGEIVRKKEEINQSATMDNVENEEASEEDAREEHPEHAVE